MTDSNLSLTKTFTVKDSDSAASVGSVDLQVFSTPSMIAYMENTTLAICQELIQVGETTVGVEINVQHKAATVISKTVEISATLIDKQRSILTFKIIATCEGIEIGYAQHKRAIVNIEKFMSRLS